MFSQGCCSGSSRADDNEKLQSPPQTIETMGLGDTYWKCTSISATFFRVYLKQVSYNVHEYTNTAISLPENTSSGSFLIAEIFVSGNFSLSISVLSVFHKMASDVNCYNLLPQLVEISVVGYNSNNNKTK